VIAIDSHRKQSLFIAEEGMDGIFFIDDIAFDDRAGN